MIFDGSASLQRHSVNGAIAIDFVKDIYADWEVLFEMGRRESRPECY